VGTWCTCSRGTRRREPHHHPQPTPELHRRRQAYGKVVWETHRPAGRSSTASGPRRVRTIAAGPGALPGGTAGSTRSSPDREALWKFDLNPRTRGTTWGEGHAEQHHRHAGDRGRPRVSASARPEHGEGWAPLRDRSRGGVPPAPPRGLAAGRHHHHRRRLAPGREGVPRTISTVAVHDGLVYAAHLSGLLICLDEKTGRPVWTHDLYSAIWLPDRHRRKVYLGDETATSWSSRPGGEEAPVEERHDERRLRTPVAAHGVLYVADRTTLYAIEEKQ